MNVKANDNVFIALPLNKVLRRPLVGSSQGLGGFLTVGSYLSGHVVPFLLNK